MDEGDRQRDRREDEKIIPPSPDALVRFGVLFYGVMAAVAVLWRMGLYHEPILYASAEAAAEGLHFGRNLVLGLVTGGAVVVVSGWVTERTEWGEELARVLSETLGQLSIPNALLLAFASGLAEEMLFRGALQPRVGWLVASLLFGLVHFAPRRELLPWTGFAIVAGGLFGGLFALTGNLVAPVVAHMTVNAVNLPILARRYTLEQGEAELYESASPGEGPPDEGPRDEGPRDDGPSDEGPRDEGPRR